MRTVILATGNSHKLEEIRRILNGYQILSLKDIEFDQEIIEDGYSFQDNALIKARAVRQFIECHPIYSNYPIIAEDSGLCVRALNYEPGINSARYSGGDDEANRQKLLSALSNIQDRSAYFQCVAVIIMPNGDEISATGKVNGLITKQKIGDDSFGYDPIFWSTELRKTFGQATAEDKDKVSHRAIAFRKLDDYFNEINYSNTEDEE